MAKTVKGDIVKEFLKDHGDMPNLRLARYIYYTPGNEKVFKDVEDVRSLIRYYKGAKGKTSLKLADKTFVKPKGETFSWNQLPEGEKQIDWTNPTQVEGSNCLILSDIHIPYHDNQAIEAALEFGYKKNVDTIYLNGDVLDFYQISRWIRDPRKRSFAEELALGRQFFNSLREAFPSANIYFKEGNHEVRYELYMISKAPELLNIAEFDLANILKLDRFDIDHVGSSTWAKFGKLRIAHGHEGGKSFTNPVNAARGVFLKSYQSIIIGHHHQPATHTENTWDGEPITCWSTGCLCDLYPSYMPKNKWQLGFAYAELVDDDGAFIVENKRILKGKVIPV
jgi:predicted phosphodiesterase